MTELNNFFEIACKASCQLASCNKCSMCCKKGGLVYLMDEETTYLKALNVPILKIGGIRFIKRKKNGFCPMLIDEKCSIYSNRPLCCRLFPLDIIYFNDKLCWAISNMCPEDNKRFEINQGLSSKMGFGSISRIVSFLNLHINKKLIKYFKKKEMVSQYIEILEDFDGAWAPITEL